MLLAALVDAGVDLSTMQAAVDAVSPEPVHLRSEAGHRGGLRATRIQVDAPASTSHRTWADIRDLLAAVDFFAPGPWHWLDPFAHLKTAELVDPALEAKGLRWAGLAVLAVLAVIAALTLPPGAPLRNPETGDIVGDSPFMSRCCQSMFTWTLSIPRARSVWITCSVIPMFRMKIFIAGSEFLCSRKSFTPCSAQRSAASAIPSTSHAQLSP